MTQPPPSPGSNPGPPPGPGPYGSGPQGPAGHGPQGPGSLGPQGPNTPPPGPPPWGWQQPPAPQWGPQAPYPQSGPPAPYPQSGPPPRMPMQQPWPAGPPPRRSHTGLIVALITALVAAIAITTVVVIDNNNDSPVADGRTTPPAVSTATDTGTTPTTQDGTTPERTSPRATSPRTTAPGTTAPPRTTAPDTTAPPRTTSPRTATPRTTTPPRTTSPRTATPRTTTPRTTAPPRTSPPQGAPPVTPRGVASLETNPLLQGRDAGLPNLVCNLPAWQSSPAGAERFFRAQAVCLEAAWKPQLRYLNMPTAAPKLQFPQGTSVTSACGTTKVDIKIAAFYCRGTIYVPYAGLQTDIYGNDPGVYMALFAHEYGHHVQAQSGIMAAYDRRVEAVGKSSAAGQDISRRLELQAQCFSGMFLGSHVDRGGTITRAMYDRAWQDQETRGDGTSGTTDHGSNAHYAAWWRQGATTDRTAQCNTFAAPAGDVS